MISDFFDHRCRVWRLVESVSDGTLRMTRRIYVPVAGMESMRCGVRRKATKVSDLEPGVAPQGDRRVYLAGANAVMERDVIELIEGPDAPAALEVDSVTRLQGFLSFVNHTEIAVTEFFGDLPEVEPGS